MGRESPYHDLIMEHIREARNYRVLENPNRAANGTNPRCGDGLTLQLRVAGERIEDIGFQCECCGISMASASMMTERVKGRPVADVRELLEAVLRRLEGRGAAPASDALGEAMERALQETVREFPARQRCAVLPWSTLRAALEGRGD
jgi:nitrogen fixation NifU-like protein